MYYLYRALTFIASPFIPLLLKRRLTKGKEDPKRVGERRGYYTLPRPPGQLIWIHAASVGETNSVLPLIQQMRLQFPDSAVLLTTVTFTSAQLSEKRLPVGAFHQFAPVDIPAAVKRFLAHWKPDIALWVDSELWANMLMQTKKTGATMGLINARMSPHSFRKWQKFAPHLIKQLLSCFDFCFAQSQPDSDYLLALGIPSINAICNLKYDASPLPYEKNVLEHLKGEIGNRKIWLASSTHPGEEVIIAELHKRLKPIFPDLLTIIVPRHAIRGVELQESLKNYGVVALRSKHGAIISQTDMYIADTMGELGLFYRLSDIVFMGGSLVPHGGQNALEPARIGCALVIGQYYHNFISMVEDMATDKAIVKVTGKNELYEAVKIFLEQNVKKRAAIEAALQHAQSKTGAISYIINTVQKHIYTVSY